MNFKKYFILTLVFFSSLLFTETAPKASESYLSKKGISLIDWYKKNLSPMKTFICPYHPTCSQYTKQAIQRYGFLKGCIMGCDRLMRCNHDPWLYPQVKAEGELKRYDPVR